jgi:signal transduction histidine kinase
VFRDATGEPHELVNPTNNVVLGVETLLAAIAERAPAPERVSETLALVRASAARIANFVRELRGFSSPDDVRVEAFDVVQVAEGAKLLALPEARAKGVTVDVEVPSGVAMIAQPRRVEQVLVNLVRNAIAAAPAGSGRVRVAAADKGEDVELTVEDDGPGIPPEVAAKLFQPFVTTRRASGGTGLGLAICARIVTELGGRIVPSTRPSTTGTRFSVVLPRIPSSRTTESRRRETDDAMERGT